MLNCFQIDAVDTMGVIHRPSLLCTQDERWTSCHHSSKGVLDGVIHMLVTLVSIRSSLSTLRTLAFQVNLDTHHKRDAHQGSIFATI